MNARALSGALQRLLAQLDVAHQRRFADVEHRDRVLAAVATKTRRASGVATTAHGSAPVVMRPRGPNRGSTFARNRPGVAFVIRITVRLLPAVFATYA